MTKDEALRLALEALEDLGMKHYENTGEVLYKETFTAIKAALEAKDELLTENGMYRLGYHNGYGFGEAYGKANAPQRTWIGLTDEEKQEWIDAMPSLPQPRHFMVLVNAIESELKEKNT